MNSAIAQPATTHSATLGGETVYCHVNNYTEVLDALIARHPGAGIPVVTALDEVPVVRAATNGTPGFRIPHEDIISETGKERAERDERIARENGFAIKPPIYTIGTMVNSIGVNNARQSQLDHAAKPTAREVCRGLRVQVKDECRRDIGPVTLAETRLTRSGSLATGLIDLDGKFVEKERFGIEDPGFRRLASRCIPAKSAGAYLADCPPELRARNWHSWATSNQADSKHILRTRLNGQERCVFSAVSETYTPFDADKIAEALELAFPADARGTADYDGFRVRVEGLWHSDIAAEQYVAGEVFKAGVIVRSDDTGGGSIRVQSVIWRNLCRNLIILDRAIGVDLRLRHTGSVQKLASQFSGAFGKALKSVEGFRVAWGSAMEEKGAVLVARTQGTTADDIAGMTVSQFLAGIFNASLKRELVPVRGRTADVVPKLLELHAQDEAADAYGVSRASIVNTFTRYAHQVETDPFAADAIREGAGRLLPGRGNKLPAPLPFEAFTP